uniref:Ovule protein n=1 Tax=Heterorhabditis bacteriophora TaxID=37862 RepID=A0A1I7WQW2_HETBA
MDLLVVSSSFLFCWDFFYCNLVLLRWNHVWCSWAFLSNEQYYVLNNLVCEDVLRPASDNSRTIVTLIFKVSRAGDKKKQQQRKESYSVYICLVLKHVHVDFDVSSELMYIANLFVNNVFEQVNLLKLCIVYSNCV